MAYLEPIAGGLRQGDLLSGVRAFEMAQIRGEPGKEQPSGIVRTFARAVIVTQDCDLTQDYKTRGQIDTIAMDKRLFGLLLCGVYAHADLKAGCHRPGASPIGRRKWDEIIKNQIPRYQNLGWVPDTNVQLVADFKDFFMVPGDLLYADLDDGVVVRVRSMDTPYRQHLLQRFAGYLMRVGLPVDFQHLPQPKA